MAFKRHFRIYLVSGHPAYIVDEVGNKYVFHRVTSSKKSGHHSNWEIKPNPDKKRKESMFIVHNEDIDDKGRFGRKLPYNINGDFIKRGKKK